MFKLKNPAMAAPAVLNLSLRVFPVGKGVWPRSRSFSTKSKESLTRSREDVEKNPAPDGGVFIRFILSLFFCLFGLTGLEGGV